MKRFDNLKTTQLIVFVVLTVICLIIVFLNKDLFNLIAMQSDVRLMCIMLWIALGLSFLFTFLDFNFFATFKQDYRELNFAVHSDPVAGIANRYSSDALIEPYLDKPLPPDMACIMLELSNIKDINEQYSHVQGNKLIKEFSDILRLASIDLCFVGRNGGNAFLVIFENASEKKIDLFLSRVKQKVINNNTDFANYPIKYKYGIAFHEDKSVKTITDLIALSNRRIFK